MGSRGIALLIRCLSARVGWVGGCHTLTALPPAKSTGTHCRWDWTCLYGYEEEKISCPHGVENLQQVSIQTVLPHLPSAIPIIWGGGKTLQTNALLLQ